LADQEPLIGLLAVAASPLQQLAGHSVEGVVRTGYGLAAARFAQALGQLAHQGQRGDRVLFEECQEVGGSDGLRGDVVEGDHRAGSGSLAAGERVQLTDELARAANGDEHLLAVGRRVDDLDAPITKKQDVVIGVPFEQQGGLPSVAADRAELTHRREVSGREPVDKGLGHHRTVADDAQRMRRLRRHSIAVGRIVTAMSQVPLPIKPRVTPHPDRASGGLAAVRVIVVHTTEGGEGIDSAEGLAQFCAGPKTPIFNKKGERTGTNVAAYHWVCDADSVIPLAPENVIANHAAGANRFSIGVCLTGRAGQTAEEWADEMSAPTVESAARLTGERAQALGIPLRRLSSDELKAGESGICGHINVHEAFHKTDHTDPGPQFPWDRFLALAQDQTNTTPSTEVDPDMAAVSYVRCKHPDDKIGFAVFRLDGNRPVWVDGAEVPELVASGVLPQEFPQKAGTYPAVPRSWLERALGRPLTDSEAA